MPPNVTNVSPCVVSIAMCPFLVVRFLNNPCEDYACMQEFYIRFRSMITKNLGLNFTTWDSVITFYFGRRVGSPKIVLIKLLERETYKFMPSLRSSNRSLSSLLQKFITNYFVFFCFVTRWLSDAYVVYHRIGKIRRTIWEEEEQTKTESARRMDGYCDDVWYIGIVTAIDARLFCHDGSLG